MGTSRDALRIADPVLQGFALSAARQQLVTESGMGMGNTADFIFPRQTHRERGLTGRYYTYDFSDSFRLSEDGRKNGHYNSIEFNRSSDSYLIEDKGLEFEYDDFDEMAVVGGSSLSEDAGTFLPDQVLTAYANEVFTIVTTTGNYNGGVTNTSTAAAIAQYAGAWDTSSTNIIGQVAYMKRVIKLNCGGRADRMVIGSDVWTNGVMQNDGIVAGLQAMQKAAGNEDFDAVKAVGRTFFNLDLAVDDTIYESANAGQTSSKSFLFGKNVLVFVSNAQVDRVKALRFGMTAVLPRAYLRGQRWFAPPHSQFRSVEFPRSCKLVSDDAAYLLTSVVS